MSWAARRARSEVAQRAYAYYMDRGLSPHQAAAIAANMAWEGGGRSDLVAPGDNVKNSPAAPHSMGVGQWNDRSPALVAYARSQGIDVPEGDLRDVAHARRVIAAIPLDTQLGFAWQEMQGPERRAYTRISQAQDLREANAGAIGYHRPAGWTRGNPYAGHGFNNRLAIARELANDTSPQNSARVDAFASTPPVLPGAQDGPGNNPMPAAPAAPIVPLEASPASATSASKPEPRKQIADDPYPPPQSPGTFPFHRRTATAPIAPLRRLF